MSHTAFPYIQAQQQQSFVLVPEQEWRMVLEGLTRRVDDLERNLDEDIKGTAAAAKFAGVSVRTLQNERDRPGTLIQFKKVGRAVSYSRKSLIAYKQSKRLRVAS
ncbi:hypothetical protein [Pontibacter burrus]|uniref:DNA-binding protein n=1 Tax=Pontibacter burrus TaxID=2704466 RepID=A0A6B3LRK5_9BACT|nr:hypothetical protein [Pontibacter burrus]NEM96197.1 hypothetical protein [Pontibacter burrus]